MSEALQTIHVRGRVIDCLAPGFVRVILGYGIGMLDGGVEVDLQASIFPPALRFPNSEFIYMRNRITGGESIHAVAE